MRKYYIPRFIFSMVVGYTIGYKGGQYILDNHLMIKKEIMRSRLK